MLQFTGKGVFPSTAIGKARVIKKQEIQVSRRQISDVEAELERFESAKKKATDQLIKIFEKAKNEIAEQDAAIFEIHIMMLEDEDLNEYIKGMIKSQKVNAEYAVQDAAQEFSKIFTQSGDEYLQQRAADVKDICGRLTACLNGGAEQRQTDSEKAIIFAHDLTPSETASFDREKILAFVTAQGSESSHTAILARSMKIPAVIGVGRQAIAAVREGQVAIVDGSCGLVVIEPDEKYIEKAQMQQEDERRRALLLKQLKGMENVTLGGKSVKIFANICKASELQDVIENDAGGIGLFRSEMLFLNSEVCPTEEEQFAQYRRALEGMAGKQVIIRTLDIGADKKVGYLNLDKEENPALGLRAIRLCLVRRELFKVQLRALYRASVYGNLGIMFPMIASVSELERAKELCDEVKRELMQERIPFSADVQTGIMIETPAAAIISDRLAPLVDFFSIGTNDLTQYTLACDRQNAALTQFIDTRHEAVVRLIELSVKNAHAHGAWAGICGELAADLSMAESFIKMGIDELSVVPSMVLPLRAKIRSLEI